MNHKKSLTLITSFIIFLIIISSEIPQGLNHNSLIVAGLLVLMTILWITQTIPMSITALLPVIIIPFFTDISILEVTKPYSNPVIFLLLGGFILALGLEKSNLHKRIAIKILLVVGQKKKQILLGFVVSTAFLSMWLSNTATCLLMLPIAVSLISKIKNKIDDQFKKILFLSIAYSASIGGMGTLIGTAPNAIFAGFLKENYNITIGFIDWMIFSLPLITLLLGLYWFVISSIFLKKDLKSIDKGIILQQLNSLGEISFKEKVAAFIISLTASLWCLKPYINSYFDKNITDASIAIFGSLLFFIIPMKNNNEYLLLKNWYKEIPWNILILFGGGLSLASLITFSGLSSWIGNYLYFLNSFDFFLILVLLAITISFLTEITSNTATIILFLPIVSGFAVNYNFDIVNILLPIVFAASFAFMMPIATPPNAIVFATNEIKMTYMIKIGIFLNLLAISLSCIWIYFFSFLVI